MNELLGILAHDIFPIFVVMGLGFAFDRRFKPDIHSLTRITFYIFSPCLVFSSLVKSELAGAEMLRIAAFTISVSLIMGLLGLVASRLLRLDARATAGLLLVCMFVNAGNYGLGVVVRAFDEEALARAVVYFTTSTLLVYTLGVWLAAGSDGSGWRSALRRMLVVPPMYAALAAILVRALAIDMTQPALEPLLAGIDIAGRAAIPLMLAILGMQLSRTSVVAHLRPSAVATGLRLVVAPVIAWGAAAAFGLTGVARQAAIVEASMPAAVINIILATEYQAAPAFVTNAVIVSTLCSPITLSLVIALLK